VVAEGWRKERRERRRRGTAKKAGQRVANVFRRPSVRAAYARILRMPATPLRGAAHDSHATSREDHSTQGAQYGRRWKGSAESRKVKAGVE